MHKAPRYTIFVPLAPAVYRTVTSGARDTRTGSFNFKFNSPTRAAYLALTSRDVSMRVSAAQLSSVALSSQV